jgi:hypothetical protein
MLGMLQTMVQPDSVIYALSATLWYDARYISNTTLSGSDRIISSVANRAESGYTMKMESESRRPILTFSGSSKTPVIRFDGVDDFLSASAVNWGGVPAVTAFLKFNSLSRKTTQHLFDRGANWEFSAGGWGLIARRTPLGNPYFDDAYVGWNNGSTYNVTRLHGPFNYNRVNTFSFRLDASQVSGSNEVTFFTSGVEPSGGVTTGTVDFASSTRFGTHEMSLGGARGISFWNFHGDVHQAVLFTRALTNAQMNYVENNVLADMW